MSVLEIIQLQRVWLHVIWGHVSHGLEMCPHNPPLDLKKMATEWRRYVLRHHVPGGGAPRGDGCMGVAK